jgi:hypothetical protein
VGGERREEKGYRNGKRLKQVGVPAGAVFQNKKVASSFDRHRLQETKPTVFAGKLWDWKPR